MGLADAFIARGHRVRRLALVRGGPGGLLDLDLARQRLTVGFTLDLPQRETELLLRARVHELGGAIEQGVELCADRRPQTLSTRPFGRRGRRPGRSPPGYLVGCDGAHSRVRRRARPAVPRPPLPAGLAALPTSRWTGPARGRDHMFFRPDGLPMTVASRCASHRWRLVAALRRRPGRAGPTLEEIQPLADQRAPGPVTVSDPVWLACFRCQLSVRLRLPPWPRPARPVTPCTSTPRPAARA